MKLVQYKYFNVILHALLWSIAFLFPYLVSDAANQYKIGPLPGFYFTCSGVVHVFIFYFNALFLYPKLLNKQYWFLYVASVLALIISSYWVKYFILLWWFADSFQEAKSHILFPSLVIFCISIFYSITSEKFRAEKQQKEAEAVQLETELKLLRSQINPHFLFNILTNLVSLARKKSGDLETSLLMLSGLMRYMLYDAGKKIALQQEVDYLRNYIALQQLRFGSEVSITSGIQLAAEEKETGIETMLLIPFVENAFKHGTGYPHQPFIDICLNIKSRVLIFEVKNGFGPHAGRSRDESSGIGLKNVQSRLALLYPGRHQLQIHNEDNLFHIHLKLML